jgi:hypothetical protein
MRIENAIGLPCQCHECTSGNPTGPSECQPMAAPSLFSSGGKSSVRTFCVHLSCGTRQPPAIEPAASSMQYYSSEKCIDRGGGQARRRFDHLAKVEHRPEHVIAELQRGLVRQKLAEDRVALHDVRLLEPCAV